MKIHSVAPEMFTLVSSPKIMCHFLIEFLASVPSCRGLDTKKLIQAFGERCKVFKHKGVKAVVESPRQKPRSRQV
jgi:hypothetical protein